MTKQSQYAFPINLIARSKSVVRLKNDAAISICFFFNDKVKDRH